MTHTESEFLLDKGLGKLLAVSRCPDNSGLFSIKVTEGVRQALAI